jgi:hypothetical protein
MRLRCPKVMSIVLRKKISHAHLTPSGIWV